MLKEKIIFDNILPVKVTTVSLDNYPVHFHENLEIMYVLEGSVRVNCGSTEEVLSSGEIAIFNRLELHSISRTGDHNMIMMLHIEDQYFKKYYHELDEAFFVVDLDEGNRDAMEILETLMASIMMEILQKGDKYEEKVIESVHNLISCIISNFMFDESWELEKGNTRRWNNMLLSARLNRMMAYIYANYDRKLTLNEIADMEGLSLYYLSHVVKEATGLSFQELLNYVRIEASEHLLLSTNKRMGAIAEEMGFSAVRYYVKHFETWYGMHPLDYRAKNAGKKVHHKISAEYSRSTPASIEESVRRRRQEVYENYLGKIKSKSVIVNIDTTNRPKDRFIEARGLAGIMERDVNRLLAEPYFKIKAMEERLMAIGGNYAVTTKCDGSPVDSLSIVAYSADESMEKALNVIQSEEELLEVITSYETEMEFLFRISGLSGKYRVVRYNMDREKLIKKISDAVNTSGELDKRELFINELSAEPTVYSQEYKSSDNMSLRTAFVGMGIEIILIDRIPE